jgi:hypothetical protein
VAPTGPGDRLRERKAPSAHGFVHIDISADDPARAARFFKTVFGWQVQELPGPTPYWLLMPASGPGSPTVGGGIAKREAPWQSVMPTIEVSSAKQYAARIIKAGGVIVAPAVDMPGVGTMVVFKDPEGHVFGILEPAATAFTLPPAAPT